MTGRLLAQAALWANGASVALCAQIMDVSPHGVRDARERLQAKYAADGITIRNSADLGRALAVAFPTIEAPAPDAAAGANPRQRGGRPSPISRGQLASAQRLRADEGMSFERIAAEPGVKRNALTRVLRRAEPQA